MVYRHNADRFYNQSFQERKFEDICDQHSSAAKMLLHDGEFVLDSFC